MHSDSSQRLISAAALDVVLGWKRIYRWASQTGRDVPDRLPFEIADRKYAGVPPIEVAHRSNAPRLVVASKKAGSTVRPFVRLDPSDAHLFQSVVDALGPAIEAALPDRDRVTGYRQALGDEDDMFADSPKWMDFQERTRSLCADHSHVLVADVAGFFMNVDHTQLIATLAEVGANPQVTADLDRLLGRWRQEGIRGIPQGIQTSSPLANIYLKPLDDLLIDKPYVRFMDDFYVFADSFDEAREILDGVERVLYGLGLSLASDKTRIATTESVLSELWTVDEGLAAEADARVDALYQLAIESWGTYNDPIAEPEEDDILQDVVLEAYAAAIEQIGTGTPDKRTSSALISCYRHLERHKDASALDDVSTVVERYPGLIRHALHYASDFHDSEPEKVVEIFAAALAPEKFRRDQETVQISVTALRLPSQSSEDLGRRFGEIALDTALDPLVRSRALLAWGKLSSTTETGAAEEFWRTSEAEWRDYAVVAIQDKEIGLRDPLLDAWSIADPDIKDLCDAVRSQKFSWRSV